MVESDIRSHVSDRHHHSPPSVHCGVDEAHVLTFALPIATPFAAMPFFFLDRLAHLLLGAMGEIDPKRHPLLLPSSKRPALARYALGVTLILDIAAILALGCWLLARSSLLPDPSVAFNESVVIILSGCCLAFAFAFYLGSPNDRGPLRTLTSAYTFGDVWLLGAALLTIASGFVLVFLHRGFRDGERVLVGGIYQILLHTAGVIILGLPGYSDSGSSEREIPSAVLLGSWMGLAICFGLIQITCADYRASLMHLGW
ncbi:hypothetical protein H6P81_007974 [Aristolochia fimbriata]|uniref:DUF998 domain-containing protein n=1 Tax=Aristolochia fimbriata TaxID=158543 RepID=A0AAV7F1P8_ARIFI|nr:hypothetical protein H6P81_007974 [Aristolochia fimbriata]